MTDVSFTEVYTSALRGVPTTVASASRGGTWPLPVDAWTGQPDPTDLALLDLCVGDTLDVGCGPGRLTHELARRGHRVLGIDLVAEAVRLTRRRGAHAVVGDVFSPLPGEGHWDSVLLADGNVGISGDPGLLLRRVRELLHPRGRAVVEVTAPGTWSSSDWTILQGPGGRSRPFRWARLAVDDVAAVAVTAGLVVRSVHQLAAHDPGGRWAAVLEVGR